MAQKATLWFNNRFPYISVINEASDFQFSTELRFAKCRHQIPLEEKVVVALSSPKFGASLLIFLQWLKIATSNLVCSLGLSRPVIKSHPEEKWAWPWATGAPQNFGAPFNISAMGEASAFIFGMQLGFAKAQHKTTPRRKVGVTSG